MGRKEEMAKIAEKLMKNRENIRNFGIVAHIDHGKCVEKNTLISLANGENKKAKTLFKELAEKGEKIKYNANEQVFKIKNGPKVPSLNKKTRKIEYKKITHVWQLKTEKLIEVILSNKLKIKTTPEHKYLTLDEHGSITEKRADTLNKNDFILAPRQLPYTPLTLKKIKKELINALEKNKFFYVTLNEKKARELRRKIIAFGMKKFHAKIKSRMKPEKFYEGVKKGAYKLKDYLKACKELNKQPEYNSIENIAYIKNTKKTKTRQTALKLPKTYSEFSNFFYLIGVILADSKIQGNKINIKSNDREIRKKIEGITRELGCTTKTKKQGNNQTIILKNNATLTKLLSCYPKIVKKKKPSTYSMKFPKEIEKMPLEIIRTFIQGYADVKATLESNKIVISSSMQPEVLKRMQANLLKFGVASTYNNKKNKIYISAQQAKTFLKQIGFSLKSKQKKFEANTKNIVKPDKKTELLPLNPKMFQEILQKIRVSKKTFSKPYTIANKKTGFYRQHFDKIINVLFTAIGNPVIKDKKAWKKIMKLESLLEEANCYKVKKIRQIQKKQEVYDFTVEENHNFIGNLVLIHNTTLTDSLVAAAGLISQELAGEQLFMDSYKLEQERGITINAANVSIVYNYQGKDYLVNLIDTPGHVDFGGDVIRAMRAVDGVIVLVDAVEGVMPQTETVIRQALKENVKPVLFINKIDRMINELKVTEQEMQERLTKVIASVNRLIKKNAPEKFKEEWQVRVENGSVAFGSGLRKWAISVPQMKKTGISFSDIYAYLKEDRMQELTKKSPLYEVVFEMAITHLPNPITAQKYRIQDIWKGEIESPIGKSMIACDETGKVAMMVTDVVVDKHAGEIATGRLYSGTLKKGMKLYMIGMQKEINVQQVALYMGPERVNLNNVPAGNIAAIVGVKDCFAGETIAEEKIEAFESFKSRADPVITVSVEAKNTKDLPKLIEVIKQINKEDPNIVASINPDTGEHLLSGMGELHLEITQYRIEVDHKIPIKVSQPIVVYRETVKEKSPELLGKSPNKHNQFLICVEPMKKEVLEKLIEFDLSGKIRKKDKDLVLKLREAGFSNEDARKVWWIHNNSVLIDNTRGIVALQEIKELVNQAFQDAMNEGPLAKEKALGVIVRFKDAKLHEDSIHRGPAQVLPAVTRTIYACMLSSKAHLLEPRQKLFISVPQDFLGAVSKELQQRRATIQEMKSEGDQTVIIAIAPVKEMIGFSSQIRSVTQGRAIWTAEFYDYHPLPETLQKETIAEIRKRKGLDPEPKPASHFLD